MSVRRTCAVILGDRGPVLAAAARRLQRPDRRRPAHAMRRRQHGGITPAAAAGRWRLDPRDQPTGGPAVPITTTGTPPAESAGTLMMRRLTYAEYDHMLADLLGDTTAPAEGGNAWSPDAPNAVGYVAPNNVADLQVDLYNQTADTVVDTAFKALAAGKRRASSPYRAGAPTTAAAETTCATQFITTFGLQAYRRPISERRTNRSAGAVHQGARARAVVQRSLGSGHQGNAPVAELPLPLGDRADQAGRRRGRPGSADGLAGRLAPGLHHLADDARRHPAASGAGRQAQRGRRRGGAGDPHAGRSARRQRALHLSRAMAVQLRQPGP